ncbi:hypothetical protein JCM19235_2024 [Vibrio maritimus]|uniref:Uncharacterized protein n=1 Tax=Vibrio maritimus TaxID=990268 RepID=A0A090RTI9_9VIBR|nr:hypothetical protein JCM19235_2024 [Vibrio maritimus]
MPQITYLVLYLYSITLYSLYICHVYFSGVTLMVSKDNEKQKSYYINK